VRTGDVQANFSYQGALGRRTGSYETPAARLDRGDATLFTRENEVEAEWRHHYARLKKRGHRLPAPDFPNYAAGSEGPTSCMNCSKSVQCAAD